MSKVSVIAVAFLGAVCVVIAGCSGVTPAEERVELVSGEETARQAEDGIDETRILHESSRGAYGAEPGEEPEPEEIEIEVQEPPVGDEEDGDEEEAVEEEVVEEEAVEEEEGEGEDGEGDGDEEEE